MAGIGIPGPPGPRGPAGAAGAEGAVGPGFEDYPGILTPASGGSTTTYAPITNHLRCAPFRPRTTLFYSSVKLVVVVAGTADTNVEVGLWQGDDGALITSSGVVSLDLDTIGVKTIPLTPGALGAGSLYWVGITFAAVSGTPTVWARNFTSVSVNERAIFGTGPANQLWLIHTTAAPGSLPDPLVDSGASPSGAVPIFALPS